MTTPERSVNEIVEEFEAKYYNHGDERYGTVKAENTMLQHQCDWLTQTLQAERQKRDEVVEVERERMMEVVRTYQLENSMHIHDFNMLQERFNKYVDQKEAEIKEIRGLSIKHNNK